MINRISGAIVDAAIEVHRTLGGPGLLESVYEEALVWELTERGLLVERQKMIPINYKGNILTTPLRLDMLVDEHVIVECKATAAYNSIFEAQTLTYLRLTGLEVGLVINFGERLVKMVLSEFSIHNFGRRIEEIYNDLSEPLFLCSSALRFYLS